MNLWVTLKTADSVSGSVLYRNYVRKKDVFCRTVNNGSDSVNTDLFPWISETAKLIIHASGSCYSSLRTVTTFTLHLTRVSREARHKICKPIKSRTMRNGKQYLASSFVRCLTEQSSNCKNISLENYVKQEYQAAFLVEALKQTDEKFEILKLILQHS